MYKPRGTRYTKVEVEPKVYRTFPGLFFWFTKLRDRVCDPLNH